MFSGPTPLTPRLASGTKLNGRLESNQERVVANHHTTPNIAAKNTATPITTEKFTLVVRRCGSTWGRPLLSRSMDIVQPDGPLSGEQVPCTEMRFVPPMNRLRKQNDSVEPRMDTTKHE
jgi:hypothetical protein